MQNIKPCWWGSNLWQTIFAIIAVYPESPDQKQIEAIRMFFLSLKLLLPCNGCRQSYSIYIYEPTTDINNLTNFNSRNNLIKFIYNLRDKVNNKLNHEYGITLNYLKKKLDSMVCTDNNFDDAFTNNLIEVPFIPMNMENLIINYLDKNTTYDSSHTIQMLKMVRKFMENPIFSSSDKYFKLFYKRNNKCRKIIDKIYTKMSIGNYSLIESFQKNKDLHIKLFYLGCTIISSDVLKNLL